jgi:hypothetical protein
MKKRSQMKLTMALRLPSKISRVLGNKREELSAVN